MYKDINRIVDYRDKKKSSDLLDAYYGWLNLSKEVTNTSYEDYYGF